MAADRSNIDMLNGPVFKPFIKYSIPIILSGILQLAFNAADVVVVGRFAGDTALAAVGATTTLCALFTNLFIGLSVGANVAAARACGAGDDGELSRVVHTSMLLSLVCGAVVMAAGLALAPQFLELMDTPGEVIGLSSVYMRIYFVGMIAMMLYNFGAAILRSIGDTRRPLMYLTIAGVVNVILNLVFVIAFKMSVAGVALATTISQCISAALVVICLMRSQGAVRLVLRNMRMHRGALALILKVGLPAGIQSTIFCISNVIIQSYINAFGAAAIAGNAAGANLDGFLSTASGAFYQSAVSFTGQSYGARKYGRIWKILRAAAVCEVALIVPAGMALRYCGGTLLRIYTNSQDVIAAGLIRLAYVGTPLVIAGIMDCLSGMLRGIGSSLTPMLVSIFGVCGVRLAWISTVCHIPRFADDIAMVYISYPISWTITLIMQLICFLAAMRSLKKRALAERWEM